MDHGATNHLHLSPEIKEGVDYYVEAGRWVFTATYLRNRQTCCESGCRHCPYGESSEASKEVVLTVDKFGH